MKKFFLLSLVMIAIFILSATTYAGIDETPHVVLGNLIKISGGNKNAQLSELDDYGNCKPAKGFDGKGTLRRLYEEDATASDITPMTEEDRIEVQRFLDFAGEEMPEEFSLKEMLPYKDFSEATWADMKYRFLKDEAADMDMAIAFSGNMVRKPVAKKTVPTAKDALLNPRDPIEIATFDNKIILSFRQPNMAYLSEVKLIDNKGNVLGNLTGANYEKNLTPVTIKLPSGAADYYLEFSAKFKNVRRYCYVLLNIAPDPTEPKEDPEINKGIKAMKATGATGNKVTEEYMKDKDIKTRDDLTDTDSQAIANTVFKAQAALMPEDQRNAAMGQFQLINDYMKEKGIKSMTQLTEKDMKEIERRTKRQAVLSWPPEFQAMADEYMKQHNIEKYEDLTDRDMKTLGKQIQPRVSEIKKANSATKKSTRKK